MTEAELLTVAHDTLTRMDVIFQFWISGTFAVLITFYFIRDNASNLVKRVSAALYSIFTLLMINRWGSVSFIYRDIRIELLEMDSIGVIDNTADWVNAFLWPAIFIIGTVSALYFIFAHDNLLHRDRDDDT